MSSILDIPDEPRRVYRSPLTGGVAAAALIALGVVLARTFALGGWSRPTLSVGIATALPALLAAWSVTGPHRLRTVVAAVAAVLGVVAIPIAASGATPSPARLATLADEIGLPGRVTREVRIGDGRCRSACSEIRRTAIAADISFAKAYARTHGALQSAGYETRRFAYSAGAPAIIHARKGKILVQLELRDLGPGRTRLAAVFLADGPTPDTSVG
ncbi:MAG: hypothetical protein Q8K63_08895 [Acidimicrobiales bacterium]|nr:hypothetical protein [Acidimicrobiales bacterium]